MKRTLWLVPAVIAAFGFSTMAWAGGDMCHGKSEGAAKEASAAKAGDHCATGMKGASWAEGKACKIGANNAVFSFAVKDAHCGACVDKIQSAAMAQKGVVCAKVDLTSKMAYVAGDKNLDQRAIQKAIKTAGFDCTLKSKGTKARAELNKLMAAESESAAAKKS